VTSACWPRCTTTPGDSRERLDAAGPAQHDRSREPPLQEGLVVHAVLKRADGRSLAHGTGRRAGRLLVVVGLHREQHGVDRTGSGAALDRLHVRKPGVAEVAPDLQAAFSERREVGAASHEPDVLAGGGQARTVVATDATRADDQDPHGVVEERTGANILAVVPALVDLRSDTVTRPSEAMRRAMASAEVGDDWYGDDPTVNRLQDRVAELTGKDAAVYLPTGTMCNQIAMHAFTRSGRFVACEATAHVSGVEAATSAVLSGIAFLRIPANRGQLTAELVTRALEPDPYDVDVVDLVALENTHQIGGGTVMSVEEMRAIHKVAADRGVPVYLDGARIFNACAVTGADVADYAAETDAMMFCLSKGLGAPIGSVLAGEAEFVREARRLKVLLGGAWRQAGIVAAAGLVALEEGPKRLHEDHARARRLAEGIAEIMPGSIDPAAVETNMVFVDVAAVGLDVLEVLARLRDEGVLATTVAGKVRMLTHVDVSDADVDAALAAWRRVAASLSMKEHA